MVEITKEHQTVLQSTYRAHLNRDTAFTSTDVT